MQSEPHMVQGGARGIFEARRGAPPVKADGVLPGVTGVELGEFSPMRVVPRKHGFRPLWGGKLFL